MGMSPVCGQFENLTTGQHNPLVSFPLCDIKLTTKKPLPRVYPSKEDASLGAHLKRKRLTKGWTRLRASTQLEVSEDTYRNWEWNWYTPELRHMKKVIDFLGFNFWDDGTNSLSKKCLLYRIEHNVTQQELSNLIYFGKTTI
jgi:DNA-binding XRE family transcriptional regulator